MPSVHPFQPLQYKKGRGDVSSLIAPPYDVLDAAAKADLLRGDPANVVAVDLPHTPAKELGPPSAYEQAAATLRGWASSGTLTRAPAPAIFAYRQTFNFGGRARARTGMACTIDALPFGTREGGGVLPHEETFSGPKEDRKALMKATRAQLSPIFGLHPDPDGAARSVLEDAVARAHADMVGTTRDGTRHEVWTITDRSLIADYTHALAGQDVFIADGHHRYTTGLNYLAELEAEGTLPADHPARRSMFVLVGMSDPGLVIGPTHRVLGGMKGYSIDRFIEAARGVLQVKPVSAPAEQIEQEMVVAAPTRVGRHGGNVFGLIDFASGKRYIATLLNDDPLAAAFPEKPLAWRTLDVAIIQHLIVEKICRPALNEGDPVTWAFPHTVPEALEIGRGGETGAGGGKGFAQLAIIVRPTPLEAVRAVSRANELMPQKSTFFYPKLATGLFMHPRE